MNKNQDVVNKPSHYTDGKIEVIDFIEDKALGFHLGNVVKYVSRAGKKDPAKTVEDLQKAKWYLERAISKLSGEPLKVTKEAKIIGGGNKVTSDLLDLIESLDPAFFPEKYRKNDLISMLGTEGIESYNHYYNNSDKCYELYIKLKDGSVVIKIR